MYCTYCTLVATSCFICYSYCLMRPDGDNLLINFNVLLDYMFQVLWGQQYQQTSKKHKFYCFRVTTVENISG